jgi:hypothetical protein
MFQIAAPEHFIVSVLIGCQMFSRIQRIERSIGWKTRILWDTFTFTRNNATCTWRRLRRSRGGTASLLEDDGNGASVDAERDFGLRDAAYRGRAATPPHHLTLALVPPKFARQIEQGSHRQFCANTARLAVDVQPVLLARANQNSCVGQILKRGQIERVVALGAFTTFKIQFRHKSVW